jgi:hypothetical protein
MRFAIYLSNLDSEESSGSYETNLDFDFHYVYIDVVR